LLTEGSGVSDLSLRSDSSVGELYTEVFSATDCGHWGDANFFGRLGGDERFERPAGACSGSITPRRAEEPLGAAIAGTTINAAAIGRQP
jgi:hypothetical protein